MATKNDLIKKYGLSPSDDEESGTSAVYSKNELTDKYGLPSTGDRKKDLLRKYGIVTIDDDPEYFINKYTQDYNDFYGKWTSAAQNAGWADAMSGSMQMNTEYADINRRSDEIRDYLDKNRDWINRDYYNSVMGNLKNAGSGYQSLQDYYYNLKDYYGQWGSQEEYDTWMRDYEAQQEYDLYQQNKKRLEDLKADRGSRNGPDNINSEIEKLQAAVDEYEAGIWGAEGHVADAKRYLTQSNTPASDGLTAAQREQRLKEIENQIINLRTENASFGPGMSYESTVNIDRKKQENNKKISELEEEKRTLLLAGSTTEREYLERKREFARQDYSDAVGEALSKAKVGPSESISAIQNAGSGAAEANAEVLRTTDFIDWLDYVDKYAGKKYDDNFFGQYAANRAIGRMSQDSSLFWNAYLDDPSEENRRMAETADELIERFSLVNSETLADDATLSWISKDIANYMPQFWDQLKYKAGGALLGAAASLGNPMGAKAGYVAGSSLYGYQTMRGAAFRELIKAGVDENTARAAAMDEAIISSIIEAGDAVLDIFATGGGKVIDILTDGGATALKKAATTLAGKNAVTKLIAGLGKYLLNAGGEYVEESTQEAVSIANQERDTAGIWDLAGKALETYLLMFSNPEAKEDQEKKEQMQEAGEGGLRLGLMLGGAEIVGNATVGKVARNARAEMAVGALRPKLQELTTKALELNPEDKAALRVQNRMGSGKNVSGMDIYNMLISYAGSVQEKDAGIVQEAAAARLEALGETGDVNTIAAAIAKQITGQELTRNERLAIKDSKYWQRVVNELNTENMVSGDYSSDWAYEYEALRDVTQQYSRDLSGVTAAQDAQNIAARLSRDGATAQEANKTAKQLVEDSKVYGKQSKVYTDTYIPGQDTTQYKLQYAQVYWMGQEGIDKKYVAEYSKGLTESQRDVIYSAGRDSVRDKQRREVELDTDDLDVNADGKTLRQDTGEEIQLGDFDTTGTVKTSDGGSVDVSRISFPSMDDAVLYSTISKVSSSASIANSLLRQFRGQTEMSAIDFAAGLMEAYDAGRIGDVTLQELAKTEFAGKLNVAQREAAYNRGKRMGYQDAYRRQQDVKKKSGGKKEGKLHFDRKGRKFDSMREQSLAVMETLSKALGVDIYVFESYVNKEGKRVYMSDRGEKKAPNGFYDPSDGSIHIDLNAGQSGHGTMLFTVAHELTHFIKDWSSVKYRAMADMLVKQYQKQGVSVSELEDNQIEKAKRNGREISRPEAFDEVVADSMESMLSDENAAAFLDRLAQRDKGLKEKVVGWLKDLAAKLKNAMTAYKDVKPDSTEGKIVAEMEDFRKEIMGIYTAALVDAGENFRENGGNLTSDGDYLYSGRVTDIQFSDRDPTEEATRAALEKENGKLREDVSRLRELLRLQGKVTGGTVMKQSSIEAAARWLNKYAGAKADVKELSGMLKDFYSFLATDKDYSWDDVRERAMGIAKFLQDNVQIKPQTSDYARDVLREVRGIKITLDEQQRAEVEHLYGSYEAFRKAAWGTVTFVKEGGIPLDSQWQEWSTMFPGTFDSEINSNDQPAALLDAIDALRNSDTTVMEYAYNREGILQDIMRAVYDSYWRVDALVTVADRDQKTMNDLKAKQVEKVQDLKGKISDKNARINQLRAEHRAEMENLKKQQRQTVAELKQKRQEDIKKLRTDYRKKLEDTRSYYQESREKAVDSRNRTQMRKRIRGVVRDLNKLFTKGTKERNVKEGMRDLVSSALASAEVLFTDFYSTDDMIRNGVGVTLTEEESKLLNRAMDLLAELDNAPAAVTEDGMAEWMNREQRLKQDLSAVKSKLKDVFTRERTRIEGTTAASILTELADAYQKIQQADESYIRDAYDKNVYNRLKEISEGFGVVKAYDMRLEQLQALYDAYKMVLTSVRNANKSFLNERAGTIEQQATRGISEVASVWRKKKESESDVVGWLRGFHYRNLKPIYLMRAIGSQALTDAYNNVRRGEDTWYRDIDGGRGFYLENARKYGYEKWDFNKTTTFSDDSGGQVKLTLGQILSLYAYSKREAAAEHLRIGGVVIEGEAVRKNKLGMKVTYHLNDATSHQLGPETLGKIIGTLTKEQRAFVDAMQDYLSTVMANKGNEVSLAMYGIKLFTEKNYFPIQSAKQFVDQKNEPAGEVKLKNSGFTNKTVPKANNPMVLRDFMDVWAGHVNEMSTYHAFVLAIEDFNRILNFQTERKAETAPVSMKQTIQSYMGREAVSAVRELIQSVNGGARVDPAATFVSKAINKFKKNAVFASMSVVIQQTSAIVRASALIDPRYFAGHIIDREKVNTTWEIIKKYAPVAGIKDMGYFDTNMGKSTVDYIKGPAHDGIKDVLTGIVKREDGSFDELLSMAPGYADKVTWCAIWEAVKRETAGKYPKLATRSEEFLQKCGERFTEVITQTQVYDSVFARSGNMRSKDKLMGMVTSFMAEPTTSINMIYDAVLQGTRGNKAYMGRAIGAVFGAAVLNAVLKSIVYAVRDDDEDESVTEKYISALVSSLKDDVLFLVPNSIPFVRDIMSLAQGYSVERTDMTLADDIISAIRTLNSDKVDTEEKILGIVGSVGNLGFPAKNMIRGVKALWNSTYGWWTSESSTAMGIRNAAYEGWSGKTVSNDRQIYEARIAGDTAHEARVTARYDNQKSADSAVVSAIREAFMDGDLTEEEAKKQLILYGNTDAGDAYWKVREWIYAKNKGSSDGYGKYNDLYDSILSGVDIRQAVAEFTENGYDEDDVMANVKKEVGRWFWDDESETRISAEQAAEILEKYFGMKQGEIQENILKWSMKKDTGISFDGLREAYLGQVVSEIDALTYLQKYGGMTEYDARERVNDWEFEAKHGYAYSDIKSTYLDEEITRAEAIDVMVDIGGKTRDEAKQKVAYWDYENKTGVDYENKASQYKRRIITRQQLKAALIALGDYTDEDADIQIEVYDWQQDGLQAASFSRVEKWHEYCEPAGVSKSMWLQIALFSANTTNDVDSNGNTVRYSAMKNVMAKIDALPITAAQKTAIAKAIGWSDKNIAKYKPW